MESLQSYIFGLISGTEDPPKPIDLESNSIWSDELIVQGSDDPKPDAQEITVNSNAVYSYKGQVAATTVHIDASNWGWTPTLREMFYIGDPGASSLLNTCALYEDLHLYIYDLLEQAVNFDLSRIKSLVLKNFDRLTELLSTNVPRADIRTRSVPQAIFAPYAVVDNLNTQYGPPVKHTLVLRKFEVPKRNVLVVPYHVAEYINRHLWDMREALWMVQQAVYNCLLKVV